MPKVKPWKNEGFKAVYEVNKLGQLLRGALPDNMHQEDIDLDLNDELPNSEQNAQSENIEGVRPESSYFVFGVDENVNSHGVTGENGIKLANIYIDNYVEYCKNEANRRSDTRTKEFYNDLAYIGDKKNGSYTRMMFTSVYMPELFAQRMSLIMPAGISSSEQKAGLGEPLYDAIYGFIHSTTIETQVEYKRQQYEDKGWTADSEGDYLKELHEAHSEVLKEYNRLSKFYDDPQNNTAHYTQDTLAPVFGRGNVRKVNTTIGIIRGEKKAIENGWGKDDLFILGIIGGIEEEMKYQATLHNKQIQEALPQFKADFLQLKNECFFSTVTSIQEKKAVADKVKNFLETQNSAVATACFASVELVKKKFDMAYEAVSSGAEMDNVAADVRLDDTEAYLNDQFEKAQKKSSYNFFVRDYIETTVRSVENKNIDKMNGIILFTDTIIDLDKKPNQDLRKDAYTYYFDLILACNAEEQQLAEDIRAGKVKVDKDHEGIKKDYKYSLECAKNRLVNSPLHKRLRATEAFCKKLSANRLDYEFLNSIRDDYIKNCKEGLSEQEVDMQLLGKIDRHGYYDNSEIKSILDCVNGKEKEYVIYDIEFIENFRREWVALDHFNKTLDNFHNRNNDYLERFNTLASHKKTAVYDKESYSYRDATDNSVVVDPKKANSQTFMNMSNALNKVNQLNANSTPKEMLEAYRELRDASKAYSDKIDSHYFAGRSENGKQRRALSGELYDYANDAISLLTSLSEEMPKDISINKQKENYETVKHEARDNFNERIKSFLQEEKQKCIDTRFNYNNKSDQNKDSLKIGIGELVVINIIEKELASPNGKLVAPSCIDEEYIHKEIGKLYRKNTAFKNLIDSFQEENDIKNMMNKLRENPKAIMEELDKHQPEHKVAAENSNNNAIEKQEPAVKGLV